MSDRNENKKSPHAFASSAIILLALLFVALLFVALLFFIGLRESSSLASVAAVCGNGVWEAGETKANCPADCKGDYCISPPDDINIVSTGDITVGTYVFPAWHFTLATNDCGGRANRENHLGWDKGCWGRVKTALPWLEGVDYQPRVPLTNYYYDDNPDAVDWMIKWNLEHGVSLFVFDWFHDHIKAHNSPDPDTCWPNRETSDWYGETLDDAFLQSKYLSKYPDKIKFATMWTNSDSNRCPDTRDDVKDMVDSMVENYFRKPQYLRIDNKPVLFIFNLWSGIPGDTAEDKKSVLQLMKDEAISKGLPGLYLVSLSEYNVNGYSSIAGHYVAGYPGGNKNAYEKELFDAGLVDGLTAYNYHGSANITGWKEPDQCQMTANVPSYWFELLGQKLFQCNDYEHFVSGFKTSWEQEYARNQNYIPVISPGWDDSPLTYSRAVRGIKIVTGSTPEKFKNFAADAKNFVNNHPTGSNFKIILNEAWDEWGEGSVLAPTQKWQFGYLDAIKDVFALSTPVVRSNSSPTGVLPAGTTGTTLFLTTNENATCKYSTTAGISYNSMTNTFFTTGQTSHSTSIIGLTNGQTYNYYIRCQDAAGIKNADDYLISFSVAASPPGDTMPPARFNGSPTGTLASGTIQTTLALATNENATCKYSTNANTSYDSMSNVFSTTGQMSHSTSITGLVNGNTYNFYIRCQDASGIQNADDYLISFSVSASTPPPLTPVPEGSLVKLANNASVYLIQNSQRYLIPSIEVFQAKGYSLADIKAIDSSIFNQYPEGSPVTATIMEIHKAAPLLKSDIRDEVFALLYNKLHWLPNMSIFNLYQYTVNNIKIITQGEIDKYPKVKLVKASGDDKVYYLTNRYQKRWIRTAQIFESYQFNWGDILEVNSQELNIYNDNILIKAADNPDVHLLNPSSGARTYIKSADEFLRLNYLWEDIETINQTEINSYLIQ